MAAKIEDRLTEQLCEAIASLKSEKQIANFLEDACTISEFKALAQRFEVARLLDEGVNMRISWSVWEPAQRQFPA